MNNKSKKNNILINYFDNYSREELINRIKTLENRYYQICSCFAKFYMKFEDFYRKDLEELFKIILS